MPRRPSRKSDERARAPQTGKTEIGPLSQSSPTSERPRATDSDVSGLSPYQGFCARWKNGCGADQCSRARQVVQARGKIPCDVAFIGEGPGMSEDVIGLPFVGPAGKVLDEIIERAVPDDVRWCIFNMVGCLPTDAEGNKEEPPTDVQVEACGQRLFELTSLARPRLIICVGSTSRDWLDYKYQHRIVLPTMPEDGSNIPQVTITHPAAILRMNVAVRGFQVQQAIVRVSNAIADVLGGGSEAD